MSRFEMDNDIAKAKTLNKDFYTNGDLFYIVKEKLFAASWQFIGNTDLVKEAGSVYPFALLEDYLDEPLVLTRDTSGNIHLSFNVCTHRGNIISD